MIPAVVWYIIYSFALTHAEKFLINPSYEAKNRKLFQFTFNHAIKADIKAENGTENM